MSLPSPHPVETNWSANHQIVYESQTLSQVVRAHQTLKAFCFVPSEQAQYVIARKR